MGVHGTIGLADRAEFEVVGPTAQTPVEFAYLLLGRVSADIRTPVLGAITPTERITQEVERFLRHAATLRLLLVDRQFQPLHHGPHGIGDSLSRSATADHEVIGIVDDAS